MLIREEFQGRQAEAAFFYFYRNMMYGNQLRMDEVVKKEQTRRDGSPQGGKFVRIRNVPGNCEAIAEPKEQSRWWSKTGGGASNILTTAGGLLKIG
jgi:hypothetical protein